MTQQEKDRIENAIRHIRTAIDVDPWAQEIAVSAMEKQVPKKPRTDGTYTVEDVMQCPDCNGFVLYHKGISYCEKCGQAIVFEGD